MIQTAAVKSSLRRRALAACAASVATLALLPGTAHAGPPPGAQAFQQSVDVLVDEYVKSTTCPG